MQTKAKKAGALKADVKKTERELKASWKRMQNERNRALALMRKLTGETVGVGRPRPAP